MFPYHNQNAQQQPTPPLYPLHFSVPAPTDQSESVHVEPAPASQFIPSFPHAAQDNLLESYRTIAPRNFARYHEHYRSTLFHDDRSTRDNTHGGTHHGLISAASHPEAAASSHRQLDPFHSSANLPQPFVADGSLTGSSHNRDSPSNKTDRARSLLIPNFHDQEQMRPAIYFADERPLPRYVEHEHQLAPNPIHNQPSFRFPEQERPHPHPDQSHFGNNAVAVPAQHAGSALKFNDVRIPGNQLSNNAPQQLRPGIFLEAHQHHLQDPHSHLAPGVSHAPVYPYMTGYAAAEPTQSETTTPAQLHGISGSVDNTFDHTKDSSAPSTANLHKLEVAISSESTEPEAGSLTPSEKLLLLVLISPRDVAEYARHLYVLASLIFADTFELSLDKADALDRYRGLLNDFDALASANTYKSTMHIIVERNFDVFIKIATTYADVDIATRTIRFLTAAIMSLNYWEVYNLLLWKPVIYHFMAVIKFDFDECYASFIRNYSRFQKVTSETANTLPNMLDSQQEKEEHGATHSSGKRQIRKRSERKKQKSAALRIAHNSPRDKRKGTRDPDSERDQMLKRRMGIKRFKLSNYDPDVIHECQLPSPEEPHKLCLRRFSRKYELTRHQETVHSKKKKLYKCFVCIKENPGVGPRIFTRHDTLAKHIRVNHKMIGNDAKAQVAYSKRNAEIVEEGDITVHVGRRKTKVDFELRAHMEKRRTLRDDDESGYFETSDLDSGDEEVVLMK